MKIVLECHTTYDPRGNDMAFVARWEDGEFRYHVWIGIRDDVEGKTPNYPVKIVGPIYKNMIADTPDGRRYNTKRLDLTAKAHAAAYAEIKRIAKYDDLMALFNAKKAEIKAFDAMRLEADRLNAVFNAWRIVNSATVDEKMALGLI